MKNFKEINRALAAEKKIFSFIAMAAMTLMMASCGGDEPRMKNFKVDFNQLNQTSVSFTVSPTAVGIHSYCVWVASKTEFDQYGIDYFLNNFDWVEHATETFNYTKNGLYPDSKYVIVVAKVKQSEADPNRTVWDGNPDYCFFETPAWTEIDEEGASYTKSGEMSEWKEGDVEGFYLYWRTNGEVLLSISIVHNGYLGHFTKKDLDGFDGAYVSYYVYNGTRCPIYDIDITGTYDKASNKIIYEGWFLMSNAKFEKGVRSQIKLTCESN